MRLPGIAIGLPWQGGINWKSYWDQRSAFWFDHIDFTTNQLIDKSGNDNHVSMVNASARTGNGANLDYAITGLLTTDTIEVVTGSDTPTIPANGKLRIGATQIVYGVTIKRSGAVWAIIPFCEEYVWSQNLPYYSYDVSGNGHHALFAITAGNITTQNNYFYLQKYGYSTVGSNLCPWNFNSWTGVFPNERFDGATYSGTTDENLYITDAGGGKCRMKATGAGAAGYYINCIKANIHNLGIKYRCDINIISVTTVDDTQGMIGGNDPPFSSSQGNHIRGGVGIWSIEYVAGGTNFALRNIYSNKAMDIVFEVPKFYQCIIVPGMISLNGKDALNNDIEFAASPNKLLRYGCKLLFPASFQTSTNNYGIGALIKSGYLSNVFKYKVVKTGLDHFGAGVIVGDVITGADTMLCDYKNNQVRQIYNENIFNAIVSYDDLSFYRRELYYTDKNYRNLANYGKISYKIGYWGKQGLGYLTQLIIIKKNVTYDHDYLINEFNVPETCDMGLIAYIWDASYIENIPVIDAISGAVGARTTYCVYPTTGTLAAYNLVLANGNDLQKHTPGFDVIWLPSYKGFAETVVNYTEGELNNYYTDCKAWFNTYFNQKRVHSIMPGGDADLLQLKLTKNYFASALAVGSQDIYPAPIYTNPNFNGNNNFSFWYLMGRGHFVVETEWNLAEVVSAKGLKIQYIHPYNEMDTVTDGFTGWEHWQRQMDAISALQKAGSEIRILTMDDCWKLIKNQL